MTYLENNALQLKLDDPASIGQFEARTSLTTSLLCLRDNAGRRTPIVRLKHGADSYVLDGLTDLLGQDSIFYYYEDLALILIGRAAMYVVEIDSMTIWRRALNRVIEFPELLYAEIFGFLHEQLVAVIECGTLTFDRRNHIMRFQYTHNVNDVFQGFDGKDITFKDEDGVLFQRSIDEASCV